MVKGADRIMALVTAGQEQRDGQGRGDDAHAETEIDVALHRLGGEELLESLFVFPIEKVARSFPGVEWSRRLAHSLPPSTRDQSRFGELELSGARRRQQPRPTREQRRTSAGGAGGIRTLDT